MSDPVRLCLVGASGLIGMALLRACVGRDDVRPVAVARREIGLPAGARMELIVAPPAGWSDAIAATRPDVLVCALGTTIRAVHGDRAAFRAVDRDLVLDCARWGLAAGARQFIGVSSVMADAGSGNFYLRTKGEVEEALGKLGYPRLDILRPGLLLGAREQWRTGERLAAVVAPLAPLLMHGRWRTLRPIHAGRVARAILALTRERAGGRFVHEYDAMVRAGRRLDRG